MKARISSVPLCFLHAPSPIRAPLVLPEGTIWKFVFIIPLLEKKMPPMYALLNNMSLSFVCFAVL